MHNSNDPQNTRDCLLLFLKLQSIQIAAYFQYTVIICLEER